jgi:hypothetical protein
MQLKYENFSNFFFLNVYKKRTFSKFIILFYE